MIVFAGPSIVGVTMPQGIELRPPAKQGDVYLATLENPKAIGIIDGYFEGVPAVWHKEILWAIANGIPVLGASSMGALRAAELDHFGMIGVGSIYENYRDGVYEDDDEVALHHAPPEVGYGPLSIAMVNIRATVAYAHKESVLTTEQAAQIITSAKTLYYGERAWPRILSTLDPALSDDVIKWLANNEVDQKQIDAVLLLERMARGDVTGSSIDTVETFVFEQTRLWETATTLWHHAAQPRERVAGGFRLLGDDQEDN